MRKDNSYNSNAIYHYTSFRTGIEKILYNGQLRMSALKYMSDPKENKSKRVGQKCNTFEDNTSFMFNNYKEVEDAFNEIFSNTKILCFTKDIDDTDFPYTNVFEDKIPYRGYFQSRMWDQYGEKHQGLCLEFDMSKLTNIIKQNVSNPEFLLHENVEYHDNFLEYAKDKTVEVTDLLKTDIRTSLKKEHFMLNYETLFFKKFTNWRDENEFRIVYYGCENLEHIYVNYEDALTDVYLGVDFPMVYLPTIKKLAIEKGFSLHKIFYENEQLCLNTC